MTNSKLQMVVEFEMRMREPRETRLKYIYDTEHLLVNSKQIYNNFVILYLSKYLTADFVLRRIKRVPETQSVIE